MQGWLGRGAAGAVLWAVCAGPALAQKNSGPLLPIAPPPVTYAPRPVAPAYAPPSPLRPAPVAPQARPGGNPDVERQAQALPLDPQTREMRDQPVPNARAVEQRLGLRAARGPATDMRGRNASSREIVDALKPR